MRPGEVSLAHNGVLFVDELAEMHNDVLQQLRQPLEEGIVHITRAEGSYVFPALHVRGGDESLPLRVLR